MSHLGTEWFAYSFPSAEAPDGPITVRSRSECSNRNGRMGTGVKIPMHKAGVQSSAPATSGTRRVRMLSARPLCAIAAAVLMLFPSASAASEIIPMYRNVDAPARAVIDSAIGFWEKLLTDPFTFTITIERVYLGGLLASS